MPAYTLTLKNATNTISAVMRYPTETSAYPKQNKTYTKYQLTDGSFAYDVPTHSTKRRWELTVEREDTGDNLLANLQSLFDLNEELVLDEDALVIETGIAVFFEQFQPVYQIGNWYVYQVVLQEI